MSIRSSEMKVLEECGSKIAFYLPSMKFNLIRYIVKAKRWRNLCRFG